MRFQLLIYLHNLYETFHEMVRVRQRLRQGNFRELLEARSHHSPLTASFLKRLDGNTIDVVVHTTDLSWKSKLQFIGTDSYQRPEVNKFRYKVKRSFSFPARARFILLLPCSAGKPYSTSSSHVKFAKAMERGWRQWQQCGTEVIVTSPIGVVPRQLEACFPAAHYDVPVTGYWDEQEINFSREMLVSIINGSKRVQDGSIQLVIAHLDGGYRQSCEAAEKQLHVPILYTCDFSSVTSPPALKALENTMATAREKYGEAFARLPRVDTRLDDLRVLIDYQFDSNIGHHLLPDGTKTRLIHGNQLHAFDPAAKETLCRIDQDSGIVVLEKKGLERAWKAFQESPSIPLKRVTFCDKEMQGSNVFPVGIERVEPGIDAGDDVFIQDVDGNLLGYGRAVLPGFQMRQARGGPVVTIIKKL